MSRNTRHLLGRIFGAACALLLVAGCGETVPLALAFPSSEAFVRSANARVYVVDVGDDLGVCPTLLMRAELGTLVGDVAQTDLRPVCDFRAGAVQLPDVPQGVHAYVAIATNEAGQVLLSGCRIADPYVDDGPLEITLSTTERYRSTFPAGSASPMCSVEDKCVRSCR
ncbi:MAG: hypothetical protein KF901_20465 [Myxococcales bacterium]|nr:hypothetical protein [Myxococcales bacterium]